jgi:subtilisin family serine protease
MVQYIAFSLGEGDTASDFEYDAFAGHGTHCSGTIAGSVSAAVVSSKTILPNTPAVAPVLMF